MKLSESTLAILNNLKNFNQSMLFYPGKEIKHLSSDKSVFITATIEEELPRKFAVYNIRELLQVISAIRDADVDFRDDHIFISNESNSVVFRYTDLGAVEDVYVKKITNSDPAFEIDIPAEQIKQIFRMTGYLKTYDLMIVGGEKAKLVLHDAKASHNHNFTVNTNVAISTPDISVNISVLDVIEMSYRLSYYPQKSRVCFAGIEKDVCYHLPCSLVPQV